MVAILTYPYLIANILCDMNVGPGSQPGPEFQID